MNHPMEYLHHTSFGIGILGVLVIVFGVACGLRRFVRAEFRAARGAEVDEDRKRLRHTWPVGWCSPSHSFWLAWRRLIRTRRTEAGDFGCSSFLARWRFGRCCF